MALEIAAQVAAGLTAVHKKGLVHRDIKPSNIMVSFEDEGAVTAKIIDLGLAKAVGEQVLRRRFQYLEALPGRQSSPAPSNLQESAWTSVRISTRSA